MNRAAWRRLLIFCGKFALAGILLAWLLDSGRLELGRLASVALDWRFALLLALVAGSMVIPALRWWWLLRIQGLREPLGRVLKLTWAGYLAALLLPGSASGDVAKAVLILRGSQARARAFSTVLADRFLGLQCLFFMGAVAALWIAWQGTADSAGWALVVVTLLPLSIMTLALAALLWRPTRALLFRILPLAWRNAWDESFAFYLAGLPQLIGCFALSLASSSMAIGSLAVAGQLLGEAVPWGSAFLAGPLVFVVNCLPFTPGGIGLGEAASSELFAQLGLSGGADMMLLTRICGAFVALPGLLPLLSSAGRPQYAYSEAARDAENERDPLFDDPLTSNRG